MLVNKNPEMWCCELFGFGAKIQKLSAGGELAGFRDHMFIIVPIRSVLSSADEPNLACSQVFLLRTDLLTARCLQNLGIAV